jgi:hypothetical protein
LSRALDRIVLPREGQRVFVAEFCGNLAGVLNLESNMLNSIGAGRGILRLPPWPQASRVIG